MMELLPPVGWADVATKRDLDQHSERIELRIRADFEKSLRHMQTVVLGKVISGVGLLMCR